MKTYYAAFLAEDNGGYSVIFPDVAGCQTQGDTLEEAFAMAIDALAGHLEVLADDNDVIPQSSDLSAAKVKMRDICGLLVNRIIKILFISLCLRLILNRLMYV